jgi:hypothetical protein
MLSTRIGVAGSSDLEQCEWSLRGSPTASRTYCIAIDKCTVVNRVRLGVAVRQDISSRAHAELIGFPILDPCLAHRTLRLPSTQQTRAGTENLVRLQYQIQRSYDTRLGRSVCKGLLKRC